MATQELDINKLVDEVKTELDVLIKKEQEKLAELKKNESAAAPEASKETPKEAAPATLEKKEESSKEKSSSEESSMKKEESSKEASMKKDDSESMSAAPAPDASASPSPESPSMDEDHGSLEQLLQSLDDEKLHELKEQLDAEMARRSAPAPDASQSAPAPSPSASPAPAPSMQMSEKVSELEQSLKKSEENTAKVAKENEDLRKTMEKTLDMVTKLVNRPARKAITDINFVAKPGEQELKKNESAPKDLTDKEIKAKLDVISKKPSLTKGERDDIVAFCVSKTGKENILKLIEKES